MNRLILKMHLSINILLCVAFNLPNFITTARVLAIFPVAARSHFAMGAAIAKSLNNAGHHITFVSPFPWNETSTNFTILDSRFDSPVFVDEGDIDFISNQTTQSLIQFLVSIEEKHCRDILEMKEIQDALSAREKRFDILLMELFLMFECYLPIAEILDIPVIGTAATKTWKPVDYAAGIPSNLASIPLEMVDLSAPKMTFFERVKNVAYNMVVAYNYLHVVGNQVEVLRQQHFGKKSSNQKRISLVFSNSHHALLSRPLPPNVIEVGGVHINRDSQTLPKDLKQFIDEAKHGVVLFTLGSLAKGSSLPLSTKSAFFDAFASIPQRVIWKFDEPIDNSPDNVLVLKWVPQRDILEHENVKAFISHCGQNGAYEAIYTGTPIVALPLFTDQFTTAALLESRGVAVRLDVSTVTKERVIVALDAILNDTKYTNRMQELSRVFKDAPVTPQQTVVYWTEYVLRHGGALHLLPSTSDMPLYQYLLLDVLAVMVFIIVISLLLVSRIARILASYLTIL